MKIEIEPAGAHGRGPGNGDVDEIVKHINNWRTTNGEEIHGYLWQASASFRSPHASPMPSARCAMCGNLVPASTSDLDFTLRCCRACGCLHTTKAPSRADASPRTRLRPRRASITCCVCAGPLGTSRRSRVMTVHTPPAMATSITSSTSGAPLRRKDESATNQRRISGESAASQRQRRLAPLLRRACVVSVAARCIASERVSLSEAASTVESGVPSPDATGLLGRGNRAEHPLRLEADPWLRVR